MNILNYRHTSSFSSSSSSSSSYYYYYYYYYYHYYYDKNVESVEDSKSVYFPWIKVSCILRFGHFYWLIVHQQIKVFDW